MISLPKHLETPLEFHTCQLLGKSGEIIQNRFASLDNVCNLNLAPQTTTSKWMFGETTIPFAYSIQILESSN